MSPLQNKSEILREVAELLHNNNYYPAVAHSAYYCCFQLMKHIWLHSIRKTEDDLKNELNRFNQTASISGKKTLGIHEFLIRNVVQFIKSFPYRNAPSDSRIFNNSIWQLRDLRTNADYSDNEFSKTDSCNSLTLSKIIIPILKRY